MNMILKDPNVVQCIHCKSFLTKEFMRAHSLECSSRKRALKLDRMNLKRRGKYLYAVALQRWDGTTWAPDIVYLHANSAGEARHLFWVAEQEKDKVHIVEVGLTVGWFQSESGGIYATPGESA